MTLEDQRYTVVVYRDDSVTRVVYEDVKHVFMTCDNTILTIAQYDDDGSHHYINWLREHFVWFKVERQEKEGASK